MADKAGSMMTEKITNLTTFENALDALMSEAAGVGLTAEEIETTMCEYAQYARMYTSGYTAKESVIKRRLK